MAFMCRYPPLLRGTSLTMATTVSGCKRCSWLGRTLLDWLGLTFPVCVLLGPEVKGVLSLSDMKAFCLPGHPPLFGAFGVPRLPCPH